MAKEQTILKVFVASPSDVSEERAVLEDVVRELNLTWGDTLGIRLELLKWETHVTPGIGIDAQDVINAQIGDDYDLFIGMMWSRFGSPTGRAASGTEEEFLSAFRRHKETPELVEILIYFKDEALPPSKMDAEQLRLVKNFQNQLNENGVLYYKFGGIEEFKTSSRIHLSKVVQRWNSPKPKAIYPKVKEQVEEDEPGLFDLIEDATDSIDRNTEVVTRMTQAVEELGVKFATRGEEAKSVQSGDMKSAKRISNNAAADLDEFVKRMETELPLFSESLKIAMESFGKAATLATEINPDQVDGLDEVMSEIQDYRKTIFESSIHIESFQGVVSKLPRTTTAFSRARRNALSVLDDTLSRFDAADRQLEDVERLINEIL